VVSSPLFTRNLTPARQRAHPSAAAQAEIASVEAEINKIEVNTLATSSEPSLDRSQQLTLLGKLLFYDRNLSVARNEACAFCHMPEAGFTGPVSALNQTTVSYPGSIRTRFGGRNPQTHTYASFSPVLHYNAVQGDMVGGAFWDMRATGIRLNSPLAEQAQGPRSTRQRWGWLTPPVSFTGHHRVRTVPWQSGRGALKLLPFAGLVT